MKYVYIGVYYQKDREKDKSKGKLIGKAKLHFKKIKKMELKAIQVFNLTFNPPEGAQPFVTKSQIKVSVEVEDVKMTALVRKSNRLSIGNREGSPSRHQPPTIEEKAAAFTPLPAFDLA
jgi:hypothetical protein